MFHRVTDPVVAEYLTYLAVERNASRYTLRTYTWLLQSCVLALAPRYPAGWSLAEATATDLRTFLLAKMATTGASTRATWLAAFRCFFDWLVKGRRRRDNPAREIDRPKLPHRVPNVLPVDAVAALLDAPWGRPWPGWRNRACFELLYGCGLRVSEGANLRLADLDLARRVVRVIGKGDKERVLPVPARAAQHLETYLGLRVSHARPGVEILFVSVHGRPLFPQGIRMALKARAERLGLPRIWPHRLRAACATHLIQNHADPRAVQALLGHARFETTERYYLAAVEFAEIQAAMTRAHPRAS